jgi:hypothetical protein
MLVSSAIIQDSGVVVLIFMTICCKIPIYGKNFSFPLRSLPCFTGNVIMCSRGFIKFYDKGLFSFHIALACLIILFWQVYRSWDHKQSGYQTTLCSMFSYWPQPIVEFVYPNLLSIGESLVRKSLTIS